MKEKKQDKWGCKFFFTCNTKTWTQLLTTCRIEDMPVPVIAYKIAYEVGKEGNLHKHMYLVFERSWRESALINRFKGNDIERVTPGTEQTVINYIGNTDKEVSKGCTILYSETYGDIDRTQGQRNDISASDAVLWQIKDEIDNGTSEREIWGKFFPYMVRYGAGVSNYLRYHRPTNEDKIRLIVDNTANTTEAAAEKAA